MSEEPRTWFSSMISNIIAEGEKITTGCKKDLEEFSSTISKEAGSLFSKVAVETERAVSKAIEVTKHSLDQLNDKVDSMEFPSIPLLVKLSPRKEIIDVKFEEFKRSFKLSDHQDEIKTLLSIEEVKEMYSSKVPSIMSHEEFWLSYFFKHRPESTTQVQSVTPLKPTENDQQSLSEENSLNNQSDVQSFHMTESPCSQKVDEEINLENLLKDAENTIGEWTELNKSIY